MTIWRRHLITKYSVYNLIACVRPASNECLFTLITRVLFIDPPGDFPAAIPQC